MLCVLILFGDNCTTKWLKISKQQNINSIFYHFTNIIRPQNGNNYISSHNQYWKETSIKNIIEKNEVNQYARLSNTGSSDKYQQAYPVKITRLRIILSGSMDFSEPTAATAGAASSPAFFRIIAGRGGNEIGA